MFFCRTCNIKFTCKRNLKQHYRTIKHKKELQQHSQSIQCYCGKSFRYQKNYQRHFHKFHSQYQCLSQSNLYQFNIELILNHHYMKVFNLTIQEISNAQVINQTKKFIIITNFPSQKLLKAKVLNEITQS